MHSVNDKINVVLSKALADQISKEHIVLFAALSKIESITALSVVGEEQELVAEVKKIARDAIAECLDSPK